jgi:signal peptidase I
LEANVEDFRSELIPDPPENGGWRRTLLDILETLFLSLVLFLGINAVSSRIRVESVSMQPTLYAGNFVFVNKIAYMLGEPERGDIIVFKYPPNPEEVPYIKRIIGLPGDMVRISSGKVFINDDLLVEPYLNVSTHYDGTWEVPDRNYFVMGDNRRDSSDSRNWGTVPVENIIGKAELIYWPPESFGRLNFPMAIAAGQE